jgi:hypothetical protein
MKTITPDKLAIYNRYGGSVDSYARAGKAKEREILSDEDFFLIDNLLQSVDMINRGLASEEFKSKTFERIREIADDQAFQLIMTDKVLGE